MTVPTGDPSGRPAARLPGLRFAEASPLVAAALSALHEAPQDAAALARRVLGLRGGPAGLTAHLVRELLDGDPRVAEDHRGVWRLTEPAGRGLASLSALRYAVVDVETTGGSPERGGRIVEVGVVEVHQGHVVDEYGSLVNPGIPMPRWVSRLTGITDQMVAAAPRFEEVCDALRGRLEGRVFVAHNVAFDWGFLAAEMRRARSLLPSGPRLCTIQFTRRAVPGLQRRGLDSVADYYSIPIVDRHRALGDARATAAVLVRLLEEVARLGISGWGELREWLRADGRPEVEPC